MDIQPAPSWLLVASRRFSSGAGRLSFNPATPPDPENDPRFKFIVDGVLFTKKFMLTYNVVIVGVLLLFTAIHQISRLRQRRRRRQRTVKPVGRAKPRDRSKAHHATDGVSVSESSTLDGCSTPPTMSSRHERTPLLARSVAAASHSSLHCRYKAFMMHQYPPIPFFNKALPSNETCVFILAFIGLNLFYIFFRCPLGVKATFIFADRVAALFVANLPLLYLLSAKNQPIKWLTGYSYEQLNILHRRLGEILCLLALLHCVGMFVVWYTILRPFGWSLLLFVTEKIILMGIFAFVAYEVLYLTSLGSFRARCYELFLILHVVLMVAALVFVFIHHPRGRIYVGIALGIFIVDRLVFRFGLKTRRIRTDLTVLSDGATVLLSANWQSSSFTSVLAQVTAKSTLAGWKPTEHVFITIPSLSSKHIIQAHPFTIASAAPNSHDAHAWLNLIVRSQDGFSKDLLAYAKTHSVADVYMDGPYGSQHPVEMLEDCDLAIVVAGGSGIAVAHPLIWALSNNPRDSDADVEYTMRTNSSRKKKVCLIWVVRQQSHFLWLGESRLKELDSKVEMHLLPPTSTDGRPDIAGYVQSITERELRRDPSIKTAVVCSGPDAMNRQVRNACAAMVARGRDVDVAIHTFGW